LYDKACVASTFNSGSAVAASTNYAKVWFNEAPFTTVDTCTHQTMFNDDALKVAACKGHTTETACEAEDS
jgi:hypothetical protein